MSRGKERKKGRPGEGIANGIECRVRVRNVEE